MTRIALWWLALAGLLASSAHAQGGPSGGPSVPQVEPSPTGQAPQVRRGRPAFLVTPAAQPVLAPVPATAAEPAPPPAPVPAVRRGRPTFLVIPAAQGPAQAPAAPAPPALAEGPPAEVTPPPVETPQPVFAAQPVIQALPELEPEVPVVELAVVNVLVPLVEDQPVAAEVPEVAPEPVAEAAPPEEAPPPIESPQPVFASQPVVQPVPEEPAASEQLASVSEPVPPAPPPVAPVLPALASPVVETVALVQPDIPPAAARPAPAHPPIRDGRYCLKEEVRGLGGKGEAIALGNFLMSVEVHELDGRIAVSLENGMAETPDMLNARTDDASVMPDGSLTFSFTDGRGNSGDARIYPTGLIDLTGPEGASASEASRNYGSFFVFRAACLEPEFAQGG